jgi:hypothetical protein
MRALAVLCLLAAGLAPLAAAPAAPPAGIATKSTVPRVEMDLNEDGTVDFARVYNARGLLEHDEFDYNYDGEMDDFLYYENGLPVREEIDSDYDGKVDIWVYLLEGKYIRRWERDLDGDGKYDTARDFPPGP